MPGRARCNVDSALGDSTGFGGASAGSVPLVEQSMLISTTEYPGENSVRHIRYCDIAQLSIHLCVLLSEQDF